MAIDSDERNSTDSKGSSSSCETVPQNDVRKILDCMGCDEVRPLDDKNWVPIGEIDNRYGTTDQTQVRSAGANMPVRLINAESGSVVAHARSSSSKE